LGFGAGAVKICCRTWLQHNCYFQNRVEFILFGAAQGSLALYMANQDGSYIASVFRVCVLSAILNFLASLVRQCRLPIIAD
jgi:hypothetical protein